MRRLRQIIAGFLALSLAVGGLVGISPDLHRLIEHGGHGPAHTHRDVTTDAQILRHEHVHEIAGKKEAHAARSTRSNRLFAHSDGAFELPTAELASLCQSLCRWLTGERTPADDTTSPKPGHHHDSLAQLLASGLVEQAMEFPPMQLGGVWFVVSELTTDAQVSGRDWEAQTASRGPPVA